MEIGKRYIFVDVNNTTFAGDVVSITDQTLTLQNRSHEKYQNGQGLVRIPRTNIKSIFDLVIGQHYVFVMLNEKKTIDGELISISWDFGTVHLKRNNERISFPFYWIQDIQ